MPRCKFKSVQLRERQDREIPSKEKAKKTPVPISVAEFARLAQAEKLPEVEDDEYLKPMYRQDLNSHEVNIAENVLKVPIDEITVAEEDAIEKLVDAGWYKVVVSVDGEKVIVPYKPLGTEVDGSVSMADT